MKFVTITDRHTTGWQLGSIQGSALGLPGIVVGGMCAQLYGPSAAILSVLFGNFILWMIALPITLMAYQDRANAIENVWEYLGKIACLLACVILNMSYLSWYVIQNKAAVIALAEYWRWDKGTQFIYSAIFAFGVGALTIFGIRYIRHLCVWAIPILIAIALWITIKTPAPFSVASSQISWSSVHLATALIVSLNLFGAVNLPTFFRHARSVPDVILGLTWMIVLIIFFQLFSIWINVGEITRFIPAVKSVLSTPWIPSFFTMLALACVNSVNVYLATAGLETIAVIFLSSKSRLRWLKKVCSFLLKEATFHRVRLNWMSGIMGIVGGLACLFPETFAQIMSVEELANNILSNLVIVLFFAYIMRLVVHHRPEHLEKITAWIGWLVGIIAAIYFKSRATPINVMLIGMFFSAVAFSISIFVELNLWSIGKLMHKD